MKEQIKQFFKKEWLNVTMYSVITLLLFCCMFWEPMVYVTVLVIALYIFFQSNYVSLYYIFWSYAFIILSIKYLIKIKKRERKFNLVLFLLSISVVLYAFIPFGPYDLKKHIELLGVVVGLFLFFEFKNDVDFKALITLASIGLLLSNLFSFCAFETTRMLAVLEQYTNYGYIKFQGLFGNPNGLGIYTNILLPGLLVLYSKNRNAGVLLLFLINFAFAYMSLSRNYIICLVVIIVIYIFIEIYQNKRKGLFRASFVLCLMVVLCGVMFTSTKIYLVRLNILPESSIVQTSSQADAAVVFPSIPAEPNIPNKTTENSDLIVDDPGRAGIWARYWADYISDWKTILFGRGPGYPALGNIHAHQGFLDTLWQFGLWGTFLIFTLLGYYLKNLFKTVKFIFILICFVPFVISCLTGSLLFNMWTFLTFVILISLSDFKEVLNAKS